MLDRCVLLASSSTAAEHICDLDRFYDWWPHSMGLKHFDFVRDYRWRFYLADVRQWCGNQCHSGIVLQLVVIPFVIMSLQKGVI